MPDVASTGPEASGPSGPPGDQAGQKPTAAQNLDNGSYVWRRLFAEAFGTFLLVLAAVGGDVVATVTGATPSRAAAGSAPGLTVMVVILFMGRVSGAHLNPVVSVAFALRGEFPWRRVPGYVAVQLVGGILACVFLWTLFGRPGLFGATIPAATVSDTQAMLVEAVLTLGLVSAQNVGPLSAIAVGGYIALAGLWAGPVSGASMNPVRSLAPTLIRGDFGHIWVYLTGPPMGALVAVAFAYVLRGRGGDRTATRAAQGDPGTEGL